MGWVGDGVHHDIGGVECLHGHHHVDHVQLGCAARGTGVIPGGVRGEVEGGKGGGEEIAKGYGGKVLRVVVCSLVGGEDLSEFGGGGNVGEALLVCKAVFMEGVFEGGNSNDVVGGICGGSAEEACHSADSIVLCDL